MLSLEERIRDRGANELSYLLWDAHKGERRIAFFAQLGRADRASLDKPAWSQAVFIDAWREHAEYGQLAFKLQADDGMGMLGLVAPGKIRTGFLAGSLLETVPGCQYPAIAPYRGVGKVLVARLVVESILRAGKGRIMVLPRLECRGFYLNLGFVQAAHSRHLVLLEQPARALLEDTIAW